MDNSSTNIFDVKDINNILVKETLNEAFLEHTFWVAAYGIVSAVSFALGAYFFVKTTDYIYASACIALGLIMSDKASDVTNLPFE